VSRPSLAAAVAVGGALGALVRFTLGELFPDDGGFPWTTFATNVSGAFALALLPALALVRRSQGVAVALGPGVLGGFTTLSAYSEQGRALLEADRPVLAATYLVGTLAACLAAVTLAARFTGGAEVEEP